MKDFKKSFKKKSFSSSGPKRSFGKFAKPRFGGVPKREAGTPIELFSATCAHCNKNCEVPFKPNGKKPVFCRDCFAKNGDAAMPSRSYERPRETREGAKHPADFGAQIDVINAKLDTLTRLVKALAE